jgi:Ca-activated chloride channel family protein
MSLFKTIAGAAAALAILAMPALAADRAMIILDGSGSMWAQIDGKARISIARDTLRDVLREVPSDLELGFISYGHREKGQCSDIEVLVPAAAGTADAISEAADAISPKGKTPLSDAVRMAAEELHYTEDKATVILITDGIETCEADPCALASELESSGIDFTTHVVGFGLSDEEGRQVACLAENTGGRYFEAGDAEALGAALRTSVAAAEVPIAPEPMPEPEPEVAEFNFLPSARMSEDADPLPGDSGNVWEIYQANADGSEGEWVSTDYGNRYKGNLAPGKYIVVARFDEARVPTPVTIAEGEVLELPVVLDAGTVIVRPRPSPDADIDSNAAVEFTLPDGHVTTFYGETSLVLPAGAQSVRVKIGEGELVEPFELAAGEVVELDLVVGVGRAAVSATYAEGMVVEDGDLFIEIFGAKKDIQGNRKSVAYGYGPETGFDLPPGDYVAVAKMGEALAETPFSVETGALSEPVVNLEAGVLAFEAPGTDFIEVFGAKKDIQGDRKGFGYGYGGALQTTLPAGDYVVVAHAPDQSSQTETAVTIVAGERTEAKPE